MKKYCLIWGLFLSLSAPVYAAIWKVNKTADTNDGSCNSDCSLREAIAVAQTGDTIQFEGAGVGTHPLTGTLVIDKKNGITIDGGENHRVVIRGMGGLFDTNFNCLKIQQGSGNVIRGLVIQNCYTGILISGQNIFKDGKEICQAGMNNRIENNYIGPTNGVGINVSNAPENFIGPGNVISGNEYYGMYIYGCSQLNQVQENIIGLNADGKEPMGKQRYGLSLAATNGNIIGPGNTISGNNFVNLPIQYGSQRNYIIHNFIGTDAEGKYKKMDQAFGVMIGQKPEGHKTQNNHVENNVIAGNNVGVDLRGTGTERNVFEANLIGVAADGITPIPNLEKGVEIMLGASRNIIGGETPERANIIAHNGNYGIYIYEPGNPVGNIFHINSIFDHKIAGIQFQGASVNKNIGIPVLAQPEPLTSDQLLLKGSGAKPEAKIYLYEADDQTTCEGKNFIAEVEANVDGGWEAPLTGKFSDAGTLVTASQTDATEGTSEFSPCFEVENKTPQLQGPEEKEARETQTLRFQLHGIDSNGNGLQYSCVKDCPDGLNVNWDTGEVTWMPETGSGEKDYEVTFAVTDGLLTGETTVKIRVEKEEGGLPLIEPDISAKIDVPRFKLQPPEIEVERKQVVAAGKSVSLFARLKEELKESPYTFRWKVTDGEGKLLNASSPNAEYTAPLTDRDREEFVTVEVVDAEGNVVGSETVTVVVLAKSVAAPNFEVPAASSEELLSDLKLSDGGTSNANTTSTAGVTANKTQGSGKVSCNLNPTGTPTPADLLWLLPFFLLLCRYKRCRSLSVTFEQKVTGTFC